MHPQCWKCSSCSKNITPATFKQSAQNKFFCPDCFTTSGSGGAAGAGSSAAVGGSSDSGSASKSAGAAAGGAGGAGAAAGGGGEGKSTGGAGAGKPEFKVETFYTLDLLKDKSKCPDSVVKSKKEEYLSDSDFQKAFGCDKVAFKKMAKWRQNSMKKKVGIF
jgi:hypothetical protein